MRQIIIILYTIVCCDLQAGLEVMFPVAESPKGDRKLLFLEAANINDPQEPVLRDGILVYFISSGICAKVKHEPETFNKLKEGMTLKEIVSLLGPGSQNKLEGIGFIGWYCKDGRVLSVWPNCQLNEKANFHITLQGFNQRHEDIRRLAKTLIVNMNVSDQKVAVTLSVDTHQAKAKQTRTYGVGETFQKVDPRPRIDFTITSIEGDAVHCRYFYQPPQDDLLRYSEYGYLILRNNK